MKHILSYSFAFIIFLLASCQVSDDDYQHASALRTKEMDLEALKQYMSIDSLANQYTVTITEEQRQKEGISKQNLKEFLRDIDALNKQIHEKVEEGHVVTMYLTTKNNFSTYTIDPHHQLGKIVFSDCRSSSWGHSTRAGSVLASEYFMDGNWESGTRNPEFSASSKVTSVLNVGYSRGYWQVTFVCKTVNSSYGTEFYAYGTGSSHGDINRYWWWTNGGSAPYNWKFVLGGSPGGEASGGVSFRNT